MDDDIETGKSTGFRLLSCTTLVERKSKQTALDDQFHHPLITQLTEGCR